MLTRFSQVKEGEYLLRSLQIISEHNDRGSCLDSAVLSKKLCNSGLPIYEAELERHLVPKLERAGLIVAKGRYSPAEKAIRFNTSGPGKEPLPKRHYIFDIPLGISFDECCKELGIEKGPDTEQARTNV